MHEISVVDLQRFLDEALIGRRCVQAWLGCASVLFIGFGEELIPLPVYDEEGRGTTKHPIPPYELESDYSAWSVRFADGTELLSDDLTTWEQRTNAQRNELQKLRGIRVKTWTWVVPQGTLEVEFETGDRLRIFPYPRAIQEDRDLWALRLPSSERVICSARCELYVKDESDPRRKKRRAGDAEAPIEPKETPLCNPLPKHRPNPN